MGPALTRLGPPLVERSKAEPAEIAVAIETPHGPVVEVLLERSFQVFATNPKQLDRFRDPFSVAGAKDDSRDARVLADSLRTDGRAFRQLTLDDPLVIELREWSRMHEELRQEQNRLTNRVRDQLWRYYPQALELGGRDLAANSFLELWKLLPTPAKAARATEKSIARILKAHRIRRLQAADVLRILCQPPLSVAPGTTEAASAHIGSLVERIRLVNQQSRRPNYGRTSSAPQSRRPHRGRFAGSATSRSCDPCQGSEGSSSPRCSPRPASLCGYEITTPCVSCRGRLR